MKVKTSDFVINTHDSCATQIGLRWRIEKEVISGKGISLFIYICMQAESYLFFFTLCKVILSMQDNVVELVL